MNPLIVNKNVYKIAEKAGYIIKGRLSNGRKVLKSKKMPTDKKGIKNKVDY